MKISISGGLGDEGKAYEVGFIGTRVTVKFDQTDFTTKKRKVV